MKKFIFIALIVLFLSSIIYYIRFNNVSAQTTDLPSIMGQNKIRTCLTAEILGDNGAPRHQTFESTVKLTGNCDAPDGCEIWQNGEKDGWKKVVEKVPFGSINQIVSDIYIAHTSYQWYAIGDAPQPIGKGTEDGDPTQKVDTENFELFQSNQNCVGIPWDPFGRVFDAVSLEPISNVQVSLFQNKSKQLVSIPDNPTITDDRGVYNIFVEQEDDYYLSVVPPATHLFTQEFTLHPNYSKVYSNVYKLGEVFHEAPLPEIIPENFDFSSYEHDIPLKPKGDPYKGAIAEVFDNSLIQVDLGNLVNYSGRVTFPLAEICLVGQTAGTIDCINADRYGSFSLSIDKLLVPQEFLEIKVNKVDLTKL